MCMFALNLALKILNAYIDKINQMYESSSFFCMATWTILTLIPSIPDTVQDPVCCSRDGGSELLNQGVVLGYMCKCADISECPISPSFLPLVYLFFYAPSFLSSVY